MRGRERMREREGGRERGEDGEGEREDERGGHGEKRGVWTVRPRAAP